MKSLKILSGKCSKASGTAVSLDKVLEKYLMFSNMKYNCQVFCKRGALFALVDTDLDEIIDFIISSVNECILHDSEIIIETKDIPAESKVLVEIKCANGNHSVSLAFDRFTDIPKNVISDESPDAVLYAINSAIYLLIKSGKISTPQTVSDEKINSNLRFSANKKSKEQMPVSN